MFKIKEEVFIHKIEKILKDKMDSEMSSYVKSAQYNEEQDKIIDLITELKSDLPDDKIKVLNNLLDEINVSDSDYSYKAFHSGIINGMLLMESIVK
ncbi:DUF6809 family protein [Clostridium sp. DL1XJH146]